MRPGGAVRRLLSAALSVLVLAEVNYPHLAPQSQLALFALIALVLCFLEVPAHPRWVGSAAARRLDLLLAGAAALTCGYVVVQTEPWFEPLWLGGRSLGSRAGQAAEIDVVVAVVGLALVLEAARRTLGLALPLLATVFLLYAMAGPLLPAWLFPHRGYGLRRLAAHTFLGSQGVFGVALGVMFTYVFLFVLFGALLEATGGTRFITGFARRLLGRSAGGPAKVAVLASGLLGSLSGSAVANTATTGTFTIPLMRSAGFPARLAAGVEAAASSGGALVPPVMGAGAYMMLEIISPPVTYLEIVRAALIPAVLYYLSLFAVVHFSARRLEAAAALAPSPTASVAADPAPEASGSMARGVLLFAALLALIGFLLAGYSPFRAVSLALAVTVVGSLLSPATRMTLSAALAAVEKAARDAVPLVAAAAAVGIVLGVVTLSGVGHRLAALVAPLAQDSLLAALVLIMVCSIVLGMGLPSAVCYLLMATLLGPALENLGVMPLAAHLFIFYFGLMSMVTPPVALAAYTAASIAGTSIVRTSFTAFRIALVGFTLPYLFVFRPELLLAGADLRPLAVVTAVAVAVAGIVAFAAALAGHLFAPASRGERLALLAAAALLLAPVGALAAFGGMLAASDIVGALLLAGVAMVNRRKKFVFPIRTSDTTLGESNDRRGG